MTAAETITSCVFAFQLGMITGILFAIYRRMR